MGRGRSRAPQRYSFHAAPTTALRRGLSLGLHHGSATVGFSALGRPLKRKSGVLHYTIARLMNPPSPPSPPYAGYPQAAGEFALAALPHHAAIDK
jgi:hypothetical protein